MLHWFAFVVSTAVAWNLPAASHVLKSRRLVSRFDAKTNQLRRTISRRSACETYSPPSVNPSALYSLPLRGELPLAERTLGPCIHHVVVDEHYDFVAFSNGSSSTVQGTFAANDNGLTKDCDANVTSASSMKAEAESMATKSSHRYSLRELLAIETGLSEEYLDALADFGAIYMAPEPTAKASRVVAASELDVTAVAGTYVRVHRTPSRKPRAWTLNWQACVQPLGQGFLAVNKPGCIPMQASVDNLCESVVWQLEQELGIPLWVTGRLDASTTGACVLATSPEAAAMANEALKAKDNVMKTYVCLTRAPVPCGLVEHCFRNRPRKGRHRNSAPTLLRAMDHKLLEKPKSPWKLAALEVLSCDAISAADVATWAQEQPGGSDLARALAATPPPADAVAPLSSSQQSLSAPLPSQEGPSQSSDGGDGDDCLYEVTVRLITGRTHQIRLQLAALGAPLIGDTRYWPAAGCLDEDDDDDSNDEHEVGEDYRDDIDATHSSSSVKKSNVYEKKHSSTSSNSNSSSGYAAIAGADKEGSNGPSTSSRLPSPLEEGNLGVVLGPQPELVALHCLSVQFSGGDSSNKDNNLGDGADLSSSNSPLAMPFPIEARSPVPWWRLP